MAKTIIAESLAAVSLRNRVQRLLESLCCGVFYGTLAALPLLLLQVAGRFPGVSAWPILLIGLLLGLVISALLGWFRPLETKIAAEKAD
ncbi:MAG: hypothetical protein FWH27_07985, partial [Planctomycetaceae bacterium]|nr:hypothetical protein [Planctomycetaceae bacterium]